jgi:hypothetical protein
MYYVSLLWLWHPVLILVRTNHPFKGSDITVVRSSLQHRERSGRGSAPELTEGSSLVSAHLRCGGASAEERWCEVVHELLLTVELLWDLRVERKGL